MNTIELENQLEISIQKDKEFEDFMIKNPVGSTITFEGYDGGFEISLFDGRILEYNVDDRTILVNEEQALKGYRHTISFLSVKTDIK
jgi:hypothetical protein